MNTTSSIQVKSTPTMRAMAACVAARVPVIFKGDPGQGKTATIEAVVSSWGFYFESVTGSNREATDFLGLPVEVNGVQRYTSLDWAVRLNDEAKARKAAGSVLFLDEFNTQEDTMKAMLRVLEERFAGPDRFEDNVAILGAMNPTSIATGGTDLPAPVANRVVHLDWVFDFDAWVDGFMSGFEQMTYPALDTLLGEGGAADRSRVRASIAQFLRTSPQSRNVCPVDDPEAASGAWPSVRTWTKAADALSYLRADDDEAARLILIGSVGQGPATEYLTWADRQDLYDPAEVLAGEVKVDWTTPRLDRLYALSLALRALVRETGDADTWDKAMMLMVEGQKAGRADIAWQGVHALIQVKPTGSRMPREVVTVFGELMDNVGLTTSAVHAA